MTEYDFEPVRGLPATLPGGEKILWQGTPRPMVLARRMFHVKLLAWYFAAMLTARLAASISDGVGGAESATSLAVLALCAMLAMGLLVGLAWALSRATVYTITNRRVVIRLGVALPMTVNIPFRAIESAGVEKFKDGTGDLTLVMEPQSKIAYLALWPHLAPWQFAHPRPMLRALTDPDGVADILAQALSATVAVGASAPAGIASAANQDSYAHLGAARAGASLP